MSIKLGLASICIKLPRTGPHRLSILLTCVTELSVRFMVIFKRCESHKKIRYKLRMGTVVPYLISSAS